MSIKPTPSLPASEPTTKEVADCSAQVLRLSQELAEPKAVLAKIKAKLAAKDEHLVETVRVGVQAMLTSMLAGGQKEVVYRVQG